MAEENQNTLDTSKYNSFIIEDKPNENILVPDIIDTGSKYNKFIVEDKKETIPLDSTNKYNKFIIQDTSTLSTQPTFQSTEQFTDAQKIRYGIDKQNTFFGNLFRVAKSGTQAAFDPDKDFKDYIKYNANQEQKKLQQKYGALASGNYEDDNVVQAAAMATMMLDPFYIAAYMTPWGRAATATLKGVSALSGVTVGLDTMMNNLATTGSVDAKSVAISTAAGATLGPLTVKVFSGIKSLLPSANTAQIQKIIGVVEGQKAKQLGISKVEFKKLQAIAGDKDLLEINKQLQKAAKNWVAPIANETKLFNATEKNLQSRIKNLTKDTKDIDSIAYFKSAKDSTFRIISCINIF